MASERLRSAQDLLDLTFQSLAMQHMDLKQVELDTAVAKVDELSRQLESLWTDGPGPPLKEPSSPGRSRSSRRSFGDNSDFGGGLGDPLGPPSSPRPPPHFSGGDDRAPSPRPKVLAVPVSGGGSGRAPSPRPLRPYEFLGGLGGSPRSGEGVGGLFLAERPPAPPPYEVQASYPSLSGTPGTFRPQDDVIIKRRPQKLWNESDLDVAYEKKAPSSGGFERNSEGQIRTPLGIWRESSLDGAKSSKDPVPIPPRNFRPSPISRTFPSSRIPVPPPPPGRPPRLRPPLPLSLIFQLQKEFWAGGGAGGVRGVPPLPPGFGGGGVRASPQKSAAVTGSTPPAGGGAGEARSSLPAPTPPEHQQPEPELERFLRTSDPETFTEGPAECPHEGPPKRPLSPTRLQPVLPAEARGVPEFQEVARVLAEMPRPLKRRGSMEQNPGALPVPSRSRQYRQLISRLLHREGSAGEGAAEVALSPGASLLPPLPPPPPPPVEGSVEPVVATSVGVGQVSELRSALRDPSSPRRRPGARVRLNPLVLLLDAALTGELDVVQQAVAELNDPSQPNDEGITALHNAICGANYAIVDFLIASGANVNSPDSHGWTPLHCAASCNDTGVCVALVRHGAAIFATTGSDGTMAVEKCDPYREGYADCSSYLTEVEQGMGVLNSGVVYALWDYSAEFGDELSFREGEPVTVLRREPPEELEWWWGSLYGHEGYVPRNYFGLFPRVRPQKKKI